MLGVVGALLAALATIALGASAGGGARGRLELAASIRHQPVSNSKPTSTTAPRLVFGIYPGGAAGTVGPSGPVAPENPTLRMAALEQLRPPGRPFILHLYASYTGANGWSAAQQVGRLPDQSPGLARDDIAQRGVAVMPFRGLAPDHIGLRQALCLDDGQSHGQSERRADAGQPEVSHPAVSSL